ncbi:MAG TPA: hypothetical protein V6D20_21065 [Candidatus Obscuribacterales bacterium]
MTDTQIEDAFAQVREKFESRDNSTGLEMLDSVEERWEALGELSDRQLAWLDRQQNETWKRKKTKPAPTAQASQIQHIQHQPCAPADGQVLISAGLLEQLATDIQRISQILDHLRGQTAA